MNAIANRAISLWVVRQAWNQHQRRQLQTPLPDVDGTLELTNYPHKILAIRAQQHKV